MSSECLTARRHFSFPFTPFPHPPSSHDILPDFPRHWSAYLMLSWSGTIFLPGTTIWDTRPPPPPPLLPQTPYHALCTCRLKAARDEHSKVIITTRNLKRTLERCEVIQITEYGYHIEDMKCDALQRNANFVVTWGCRTGKPQRAPSFRRLVQYGKPQRCEQVQNCRAANQGGRGLLNLTL